jgi:hypothetical protein
MIAMAGALSMKKAIATTSGAAGAIVIIAAAVSVSVGSLLTAISA